MLCNCGSIGCFVWWLRFADWWLWYCFGFVGLRYGWFVVGGSLVVIVVACACVG